MPQFQHNRANIHYEIAGERKPVLLIAGIASDSASWGPLVSLLPGRQVIRIDNRGCGQTKVDGPIEIAEMADDCAALLKHFGLGGVDVVGHSLGGTIGLGLATRHPELVARMVTLTSGTISASARVLFRDMARLYFTMAPQDWYRLLYQWLFSEPFFEDEDVVAGAAEASTLYPHRQSPGDFARQVAAIDRAVSLDLAAVKCPVLAVAAELDLLASPKAVRAMHTGIRDLQFTTIANAAHSVHWEKPMETADAIRRFLR